MKTVRSRREEILDTALDIISSSGIQRLTVKNLARALKVTEPALYRHFTSKRDLLYSLIVMYGDFFSGIAEKTPASGTTAIDRVGGLYRELFREFTKRPALSMVLFTEELFRFDRQLSREVLSIIEMIHDTIEGILRNGARRGEVRQDVPSRQMSWMVMGTMRLVVTKWRISGYTLNLSREGRKAFSFVKKVLAK